MIKLRGTDCFGSGAYGASRGSRKHNGIDITENDGFLIVANASVIAYEAGEVTKLGYPYNPNDDKKGNYRYVEITSNGYRLRYFYIGLLVEVGDDIERGQTIGWSQDLECVYPGITQHVHFEIKDPDGKFIDPVAYLKDLGYEFEEVTA
jgi:murein DD-endopeptidase MepM/ murein hydrolase activator NlpD